MQVGDIGEEELLSRIKKAFGTELPAHCLSGIGDDCAVLRSSGSLLQVVTTDMLVEGVHFLLETTSAECLGHKALAVNISDVAAMGALPRSAFLSLALPRSCELEWFDGFIEGFRELAEKHGMALLGGDLTASPSAVTINVCVLGDVEERHLKTRGQAEAGDIICVTGTLGDSGTGLRLLSDAAGRSSVAASVAKTLVDSHLVPTPHVEEGLWLGTQRAVKAMMDVSDGVATDLHRLCSESLVGARIDLERLPLSPEVETVAETLGWDLLKLAIGAGEDYCLLATVENASWDEVATSFEKQFGKPLFQIGACVEPLGLSYYRNGEATPCPCTGYDHFR